MITGWKTGQHFYKTLYKETNTPQLKIDNNIDSLQAIPEILKVDIENGIKKLKKEKSQFEQHY